jgi:NADH:ubiquinone oxidoreductase subunit E
MKKMGQIYFSSAVEWMAAMCSHTPSRAEQIVKYYRRYRNISRVKRWKNGDCDTIPCILESEGDEKFIRRNWARLMQKSMRLIL